MALAEELGDPFSLAFALCYPGTIVSEVCGGDTGVVVERGLNVATVGEFSTWVNHAKLCRRYLRFKEQWSETTLGELRHSVVVTRHEAGFNSNLPYYMTLLARAYQQADRIDEGLRFLDDAQESVEARGEHWWEAEVLRLKGEFLLSRSTAKGEDAKVCFERALAVSRNQEAKSLELRAATSLVRLWQSQAKTSEAYNLLKPIHDWFTEGFDTPDLMDAKALIDKLN